MISKRDYSIDIVKGFITILMIFSRSMSFLGMENGTFAFLVNLTTFPGFMYCFGYVCNIAYLQKEMIPIKRMVVGSIKTFGAYYLSAFMYVFFVIQELDTTLIGDLLTQKWIAGYSEFLLSWAYLYLLMIICAPLLKRASKNGWLCFALVAVSLACTFIDYESIKNPWMGPIIGYKSHCYFPLLQYFGYFLMGSYMSQNKIKSNLIILAFSFMGSIACFIYIYFTSQLPQRWGPSFLWVTGASYFIYIYYLTAKNKKLPTVLSAGLAIVGKQTLIVLLVNNFFCFMFYSLNINNQGLVYRIIALFISVIGSVFLPTIFAKALKCRNQIYKD